MQNYEQAVFISYAWGTEREEIVNQIDEALKKRGITIVRDKRDLEYKGSIQEFMERIGQGTCVIVVVSDKYLRSPNCMYELVEISDNKQFADRIFPIVLADANIYDPVKRIDYIEYWEQERTRLASAIKKLDPANLHGIREEMDLYDRIRDKISGLTSILKDMNTLTPEMHQDSNFGTLYDTLEKRIREGPIQADGQKPTENSSQEAVNGLVALHEMMQRSSDVRKAVIEFQTDFKVAREQVSQLGDYKDLHDLLHRLQFMCYNVIVHAAARFPEDETALDELNEHILTFENIVDELKRVASKPSMPKEELRWINEAEQMKGNLQTAVQTYDDKILKNTIRQLNRLLGTYPARINNLLASTARALRLPELVGALTRVCNELASPNFDPDKMKVFQVGVEALGKLEKTLEDLIDQHDRWQTLEVELRLIETLDDHHLEEFEADWPFVKEKAEGLYIVSTEDWANALKDESQALDEALDNNDPVKIRRSFRNYQRRATNRFYQVDLELKALCDNLRQIGVPLASVLEMTK